MRWLFLLLAGWLASALPPLPPHPSKTFGFVLGVHFSGTSVLHYALGRHPEVSIMHGAPRRMDEGQFFQDVMPDARVLGNESVELLFAGQAGRPWEVGRFFALNPRAHLTELSPDFTPAAVRRLRRQWFKCWNTSMRVLVEKSPPDLVRSRFLAAVFPPAWFALILRHPLSVCKRVTPPRARLVCAQNWLAGYEQALADVREGGLTAHVSFYEHWAAHPIREMEALSAAVGLSRDGFSWADVIEEGAQMDLTTHAERGWGYSGPLTAAGVPDVSGKIYVDGSRLLPEEAQDVGKAHRGEPELRGYRELERRLNAFGYSFWSPFILTDCPSAKRRAMGCAARRWA
jgi:Sulfotransferase family